MLQGLIQGIYHALQGMWEHHGEEGASAPEQLEAPAEAPTASTLVKVRLKLPTEDDGPYSFIYLL